MKNENEKLSKSRCSGDNVVSTAVAKRDLPHVWGVGRFLTYYSVKDLDRIALRVHGAAGLGKKKAARTKRVENKEKRKVEVLRLGKSLNEYKQRNHKATGSGMSQ